MSQVIVTFVGISTHIPGIPLPVPDEALAPGLPRAADLVLVSVGPAERGDVLAFIDELYAACEGGR